MARLGERQGSEERPTGQFVCGTCGENVGTLKPGENRGIWRDGAKVHHCDGISSAFGARYKGEDHHFTSLHPLCWKCGAKLGCGRCSGPPSELLCMNGSGKSPDGGFFGHGGMGPVWATPAALAAHGLLGSQKLDQYPDYWHAAYRESA